MQYIEPNESCSKWKPVMMSVNAVNRLAGVWFQLHWIGNGDACCRIAKIYPVEELIHLSLALMIFNFFFLSDFMAEHMFTPFSQVSSDTKPIKIAGKESELLTSQHWNRTSGMTFEPINVADKNLIRQVWLCFLDFAFWLAVDHNDRWKHVYVNMLHRPHIYASKLQSVHNRPTVVRYRENCAVFCHPFQCT